MLRNSAQDKQEPVFQPKRLQLPNWSKLHKNVRVTLVNLEEVPNFLANYGCEGQSRDKPEFIVHQICTIHVLYGEFWGYDMIPWYLVDVSRCACAQ